MTLDAVEFIRRFLQHVLPSGFVKIRHFGFLANPCRKKSLLIARALLVSRPEPEITLSTEQRRHSIARARHAVPAELIVLGWLPPALTILAHSGLIRPDTQNSNQR